MIKKYLFIFLLLTSIFPFHTTAFANTSTDTFKAAFIRNDDLWIKTGKEERKVTSGEFVRYPKWSHDGAWLAYLKGTKEVGNYLNSGELWVFNIRTNKHVKVKSNVNHNFQWSPQQNKITFFVKRDLYVVDTGPSSPFLVNHVAAKVENFSWLPNGRGLLISSRESQKLHSNILLSKISLGTALRQKPVAKLFFTIPVGGDEYYISTSQFKWSHDKRWISFLLIPTASLSADSNTLCLLSFDGKVFKRVDEMLSYEDWFQWSPANSVLGYIGGGGREAMKNKQLKTVSVPSFQKGIFTPRGYADRDLAWKNGNHLYVSRAKESELVEVKERPLPSIYEISLSTSNQHRVTFPSKNEGDFAPQFFHNHLFWVRTDRESANIYVSRTDKFQEKEWIKNVTVASWYYEKWHWDEVFSLFNNE